MNRKTRRLRLLGATVGVAAALSGATLSTAQAITNHSVANLGIPSSVDPDKGLASQGASAGSDSIYITSRVKAHGHVFGVLVQTINVPAHDQRIMTVAVTDETTGWSKSYQTTVAAKDYSWSTSGLNIKMPGMTWSGD